jgi:predicted O-methyltransferase YrrM
MANRTVPMTDAIHAYMLDAIIDEPDALVRLRERTASMRGARMQIGPEQGHFMGWLVRLLGATRGVEVGTFTGYSATVTALALPPEGRLICCDVSEEYGAVAKEAWVDAGVADKVELRIGPALETLDGLMAEGLAGTMDFAFIDADKGNYDGYYERCLALLRPGGVIAVDNVLWGGSVADPAATDGSTEALRAISRKAAADGRVDATLVPIGDGLLLCRKR